MLSGLRHLELVPRRFRFYEVGGGSVNRPYQLSSAVSRREMSTISPRVRCLFKGAGKWRKFDHLVIYYKYQRNNNCCNNAGCVIDGY